MNTTRRLALLAGNGALLTMLAGATLNIDLGPHAVLTAAKSAVVPLVGVIAAYGSLTLTKNPRFGAILELAAIGGFLALPVWWIYNAYQIQPR